MNAGFRLCSEISAPPDLMLLSACRVAERVTHVNMRSPSAPCRQTDPGGSFLGATALHDAVRKVTSKPVQFVINTGGQDRR
jgi:hypothetical protein